MLSLPELIDHFQRLPAEQLDILVELRNLVAQIAPGAAEEVRRRGLVYYWAERGGPVSAGICQILVKPDCIHLAFIHGAFLPDPAGLLRSEGRLAKRYVRIDSYLSAPWEELRALIEAHAHFDPHTQAFRQVNKTEE